MKSVSLLTVLFFTINTQAFAQDIIAPNVQVQNDGNHLTVNAPGVHVETQPNGVGTTVITKSTDGSQTSVTQTPSPSAPAGATPTVVSITPAAPAAAVVTVTASTYAGGTLDGTDFSNRDLSNTVFTNASLVGASFSAANLRGANFSNANLTNVNFSNANLSGATLVNATFTGANLTNANLSGANLTNATFNHALISGVKFDNAVMTNVDLSVALRQAPAFVNAQTITNALIINPQHPKEARKIDLTINFDFNSDMLTSDGKLQVKEIAAALKNTGLEKAHIRVEGHTDNVGTDSYNKALSYHRAQRVKKTLVEEYGIPASHLKALGFGKSHPIASNNSDIGRAMNRRVTLVNSAQ